MFRLRDRHDRVIAILHQANGWFWVQAQDQTAVAIDKQARAIFTPQDPSKRNHLLIICEPQGSEPKGSPTAGWTLSIDGNQTTIATGTTLFELLNTPAAMAALKLDPAGC